MTAKIKKILSTMLVVSALNISCLMFIALSPYIVKDISLQYYLMFISFLYTFLVLSLTGQIWMTLAEKKDTAK